MDNQWNNQWFILQRYLLELDYQTQNINDINACNLLMRAQEIIISWARINK